MHTGLDPVRGPSALLTFDAGVTDVGVDEAAAAEEVEADAPSPALHNFRRDHKMPNHPQIRISHLSS